MKRTKGQNGTAKLRVSKAIQANVAGRRMAGQSYREIAKAEGISKNTVTKILSQEEYTRLAHAYRCVVMEMVPAALKGLRSLLKEKDRTAIIETLYGAKVFAQKHDVEVPAIPEGRTYAMARVAFFRKHGRWPSDEEAKQFDRTIDVKPLVKASAEFKE